MQTQQRNAHGVSLWEATGELIAAGQQVILDRVELLRSEITEDVRDLLLGGALITSAMVLAGFGWVILCGALVALLHRWLPLDGSLALVAAPHIIAGVVLATMAVRRFRHIHYPDTTPLGEDPHA
jgi:hypothetical protein